MSVTVSLSAYADFTNSQYYIALQYCIHSSNHIVYYHKGQLQGASSPSQLRG